MRQGTPYRIEIFEGKIEQLLNSMDPSLNKEPGAGELS